MPNIVGSQVFELKDFQLIGTNQVLNVYHYRKRDGITAPVLWPLLGHTDRAD